jgi:saccharopine dehydrogenase (NAD+, L-lysine-forming)
MLARVNKMKAVQLGCGITGLVCAEQLAKNKKVSELVLADIDTAPAQALAKRLKSDKITVTKVDATDEKALRKLIKGADVLVSSVSWTVNMKVIKVAVKTNTNYVEFSMSFDWDFIDNPKKYIGETDATILSCMGSDPGISDVFARHSADMLDRVDRIRVMDGDSGSAEGYKFFSLWSPHDMMDEVSTPAGIFKGGKMTKVPPLSSSDLYEFPRPIGKLKVFNTDHEETYLMSRLIKGVRDVDFRIAIDDDFANVARVLRLVGMHRLDEIDVRGMKIRPIDVLSTLMPKPTDLIGKVKGFAAVVVETTGMKDGKNVMIRMSVPLSHEEAFEMGNSHATGYLVGIGGAIGAEMLLDGKIKQKGAVFPEQIDSEEYIKRLRGKGLKVTEQTIAL